MEALTPPDTINALMALGVKKCRQGYFVTFGKSWFAGFILCFGAMVVQVIQGGAGDLRTQYPGLILLVAAFFFPVGLIMLVLTGQDLCTANFMLVGMTCLKKKTKLWELPVNWIIVFFGNLAGVLCYLAFIAHYSDLYASESMIAFSQSVAVNKTSQDWGACLLRGIGCNFLVCMAIWLGAGARDIISKVVVLHFPIFVFVFLGFEHVIVNMYYIPMGILNGADVSIGRYIGQSMIPSLIGNIIGGLLLGIPMVLMHQPVELPMFTKRQRTESVVVREEGGHSQSPSEGGSVSPVRGEKK